MGRVTCRQQAVDEALWVGGGGGGYTAAGALGPGQPPDAGTAPSPTLSSIGCQNTRNW
jgi:hypothetical protein